MTDQSRIEAVARGIAVRYQHNPDKAWEDYIEDAQAAIAASDAWLKARVDIAASRIKDRWMHVQPRETLSWHQVAETTVEALLWEPDQ